MRGKKCFLIGMIMCLMLGMLSGCSAVATGNPQVDDGKVHVICTTFSLYDWTRQIVGENDNVVITYLLENGTDIHSYQPGAKDVADISSCDVLVYVGGTSEEWLDEMVQNAMNPDMQVVRLMDVLKDDIYEEELVEGMQEHEHEHEEGEGHHDEALYDEHVWLSLKNAKKCCEAVKVALCEADASNAQKYEANYESYAKELDALDNKFVKLTENATYQTILVGDRFPFRYLVEDYNIAYYAAFPGCSAETEASFETVAFLSEKMDEENLPAMLVIENSDEKIAKTILNNTQNPNRPILVLNSLQSVGKKDLEEGVSYLSVMEENYEVLEVALN